MLKKFSYFLAIVGGIMAPQRCPRPNPQDLKYVKLHGKGRAKVANPLILNWGDILDSLSEPCVITGVFIRERGGQKSGV